jgi:hypothetical protein
MIDEKKFIKASIIFLIAVGLIVAVFVTYRLYSDSRAKLSGQNLPTAQVQKAPETDQDVIERVARHMVMPTGVPKVVTVKDVETLRKQEPFFAKAQDGDKLLVYSDEVVLYSPRLDRVVEIAQIKAK